MARGLVVIDIQKDYFPGGRMELVGAEAAAGRAQELLAAFRSSGEPVFHVQHVWDAPDAPFFAPETEGVEIHPDVAPGPDEPLIVKQHANAFLETSLADDLRGAGVEDVVICGMMTSMCVDASVRASADLGFNTSIAADACAAPDLKSGDEVIPGATVHKTVLAALGSMVADVRDTSEIIAAASEQPK
jgi:nicotinamidase-related amidase